MSRPSSRYDKITRLVRLESLSRGLTIIDAICINCNKRFKSMCAVSMHLRSADQPRFSSRSVLIASNIVRQTHVKCNAFRQKKHRHLEKNPNEHDLGLYDIPMNI